MKLTDFMGQILSFFFPEKCICCLDIVGEGEGICAACKEKLDLIEEKRCLKCGMGEKFCECSFSVFRFEGVVAPFYNSGSVRQGIFNAKFRGHVSAHEFFIRNMCLSAEKYFSDIPFDAVTFVPAGRNRLLEHGYNQSEILAKGVAKRLNLPVYNLLKKSRKAKKQHGIKHFKERFSNVHETYEAKQKISFKNILLVDDIKTTGATLDECARQLKLSGCENVYCLTAAITNPRLKKVDK